MLNSHQPRPRRRFAAVLGVATSIIALGTVAPGAHADSNTIDVSIRGQRVFAQFTDCPTVFPATGEVHCLATQISGFLGRVTVGDLRVPTPRSDQAEVVLFDVVVTPTEFSASVRGITNVPARVHIDDVAGGRVSGSASFDDGSVSKFDVRWKGVGVPDKSNDPVTFDLPLCPNGQFTGTSRVLFRDAVASGSVVTNGSPEIQTSAVFSPSIRSEVDKGVCA